MNEVINKFVNNLPFELHLYDPIVGKYSACGPGTKHKQRIKDFKNTGNQNIIFKNRLDKACFYHDSGYNKFKDAKSRIPADRKLITEAEKIAKDESLDGYQRGYASMINKFFKQKIGSGLRDDSKLRYTYFNPRTGYSSITELSRRTKIRKDKIKKFLESQPTYTLHKPIKRKFKTRKVLTGGIDHQWQADLIDMRQHSKVNNGNNYILTVIDIFSKFAFAVPIKRKIGSEITKAFKNIFKTRKPFKLQTDKGTEFINKETQKLFKDSHVQWFTTQNETKAQIVERFNRTLQDRMFRYLTANNTKKWVNVLDSLVQNYNTSYHRTIKMTPIEASKKENEEKLRKMYYKGVPNTLAKFKVGDMVRISKIRTKFKRGYTPNFTSELFYISKVLDTDPITYRIKDKKGEEIIGSFYKDELSIQRGKPKKGGSFLPISDWERRV